ncbi:MAG: DUF4292 domain-containing protein [Saprospiraceae bacterium]|nr:DUF4292 domain-containing protein [Saprospiraceae bacterium]
MKDFKKDYTTSDILKALENHNQDFTWFHGKASAEIRTTAESRDVHMVLRMRHDSAVWVVVKKYEVEAARMLITPEEYTLLLRLEDVYQKASFDKIRNMVGINIGFADVQQWMFGNIILPETDSIDVVQNENDITVAFTSGNWSIKYVLDNTNLTVKKASVLDETKREMTILYDHYKKLKNGTYVAFTRSFLFPEGSGATGSVKLKFSEIEVNIPKELKFVIPSHYREFE